MTASTGTWPTTGHIGNDAGLNALAGAQLSLLGGFELWSGDRLVDLSLTAQRLVALLALRNQVTSRLHVIGTLWPESTEARASACLRSLLWRLHRLGLVLVEGRSAGLRLSAAVGVDVREFVARADQVAARSDFHVAQVASLARSGELLPGWYDDWVLVERERLRHVRIHALEALCERLTSDGRFGLAMEVGLAAVAAEPLRESAHRLVIRIDIAEGNRADATRHFSMYKQLLHDELDLEPSPLISDLIEAWRR